MFNVGMCDDNGAFLDSIGPIVEREFKKTVSPKLDMAFTSFASAEGVLQHVKTNKLDLLFLDIDMPRISGFELAKTLGRESKSTLVVFMSAYDSFMYESFDFCPFAYIKKSSFEKDLQKVVRRVNEEILSPQKYVSIISDNNEVEIDVGKILCFESDKNYYIVHLIGGGKYVCRGTLSGVEEKLSDFDFYKVHSAFLVNLEHAGRISEDRFLHLGAMCVPVAQKRVSDFKKALSEFMRRKAGI